MRKGSEVNIPLFFILLQEIKNLFINSVKPVGLFKKNPGSLSVSDN